MYVAVTRARDSLVLSFVDEFATRTGVMAAEPSRFLKDAGLVDQDGNPIGSDGMTAAARESAEEIEAAVDAQIETGTRVPVLAEPEKGSGEYAVVPDPAHVARAFGEGACLECGASFESCRC